MIQLISMFFCLSIVLAQPPMSRKHTVLESAGAKTIRAENSAPAPSEVKILEIGPYILIKSNGIPNHKVGEFPNSGNPNAIQAQSYKFKIPKKPIQGRHLLKLEFPYDFGVAVNGVPFDPGAAEWYNGDRSSGWQYEALSGAVTLGIDENHAHVQPTGAYHYHGLPTQLLQELGVEKGKPSPIVGYAADGFKIYALYGKDGSEVRSSYRLKKGMRPIGGKYDGTFVADYEFVDGKGQLDECNGMEFNGSYAYFLTREFPVIPRCFRGVPDVSFKKQTPGGQQMGRLKRRHSKRTSLQARRERPRNQHAHHHGHGPPKEALSVCKSKNKGDDCSFKTPRGMLSGTCLQPPHGGDLACRP